MKAGTRASGRESVTVGRRQGQQIPTCRSPKVGEPSAVRPSRDPFVFPFLRQGKQGRRDDKPKGRAWRSFGKNGAYAAGRIFCVPLGQWGLKRESGMRALRVMLE